ncbi:MAG: hypothetical protein ACTSR8_19295 [Promethearchaeota archaeon]
MSDHDLGIKILDLLSNLLENDSFGIETIDKLHPKLRSNYYIKLRNLMEDYFPEIIEQIKFAGKEELDKIENDLIAENNLLKLKILKIIRAIFYC